MFSSCRALAISLALLLCPVVGCESPADPPGSGSDTDGPMSMVDGGDPTPKTCTSCRADEVCVDGSCVTVPKNCPCPQESYCNLGTSMCVVGCLEDGNCATGRICDGVARKCAEGCRTDAACGKGKICDKSLCRVGCRRDPDCGTNEYCDSVKEVCMAGCTADSACMSGQICDNLRCRAGCRADAGCTTGQICESTTCRAGCRNDMACKSGQICESLKCRTGCRNDMDCGTDSVCKSSTLTCLKCDADADEATDSTVRTSGRSVSERKVRVLCGKTDVDRVTWVQSPPNPGYYRKSVWVTTTGATASAKTNISLNLGSGVVKTFVLSGNATQTIWQDSFDYYCGGGVCAGWTYTVSADSDSDTPPKVEFGFSVSSTR